MSKKKVDKAGFARSKEGKAAIWIVAVGCVGIIIYALLSLTTVGSKVVSAVFGEPPPPPVRHYSLQRAFNECRLRLYDEAGNNEIQQVTLDSRSTRYVESRVEYLVFLNVKMAGQEDTYWSSCEISASSLEVQRFRLRADNAGGAGNIFGF